MQRAYVLFSRTLDCNSGRVHMCQMDNLNLFSRVEEAAGTVEKFKNEDSIASVIKIHEGEEVSFECFPVIVDKGLIYVCERPVSMSCDGVVFKGLCGFPI